MRVMMHIAWQNFSQWSRLTRSVANLLAQAILDFYLYAFTNSNHFHQSVWAERFRSLLQPFERVFSSPKMGMRKSEERASNYITEQILMPVGRISFFDELWENVSCAKITG
jgi:FMN phosphatase YigB (HAD superfamily)